MFNRRFSTFFAATALGVAIAIPPNGHADDTDIYKAPVGANQEVIKPNVLMVLDTSDSMNVKVLNTGADPSDGATADDNSRLEEMRTAMVALLGSLDNVNVGLMRFNGHRDPVNPDNEPDLTYVGTGGPVLFPVKDLDLSVFAVRGEAGSTSLTVLSQVNGSTDDAEETLDSTVLLTDSNLNFATRADEEITNYILASSDDGMEKNNDTTVLACDGGCANFGDRLRFAREDFIGLRFDDVQIPKDAVIVQANLSFVSHNSKSGTSNVDAEIKGVRLDAVTDDIPTFTAPDDFFENLGAGSLTAALPWTNIDTWSANEAYTDNTTTPDLSAIVTDLVDESGWTEGKPIVFRVTDETPGNDGFAERRIAKSFDHPDHDPTDGDGDGQPDNPQTAQFFAVWQIPEEPQRVGLRFDNVRIPQGATIVSASIDFIAKDPTIAVHDDPTTLNISVDDVANSGTFTDTADGTAAPAESETIDERTWFGDVQFDAPTIPDPEPLSETDDFAFSSDDIKTLVQRVVDKPYSGDVDTGWCGGNAMSFRVTGTGRTVVHSFDSDPTKAPVLRVTFDQSGLTSGEGCIEKNVIFQTSVSRDDAEEDVATGAVALTTQLRIGNHPSKGPNTIGLRFSEVDVVPGTEIIEANIEFTSFNAQSGAVTIGIAGLTVDTAKFVASSANISDTAVRPRTTATVPWVFTAGAADDLVADEVFETPDVSTLVTEIIGGAWAAKDSMGFVITHTSGTARRVAKSYNTSALDSPLLRMTIREFLGGSAFTVRQRLIEIVNQQIFTLNRTPTIETLYEAARYWRGEGVHFADERCCSLLPPAEPANNKMRNARVSHPGTYTGGTLIRESGCTDANLAAIECISENISGSPVYESPFANQECQNNFMIFLSDGAPTQNAAEDLIEDNILLAQCATDNFKGQKGRCGKDLLEHLATVDQDSGRDGDQLVTSYTVGFNLDSGVGTNTVEFMEELVEAGGGTFTEATDAASLTAELQSIFADILDQSTSFASPALSVNAFNKLFTRDVVYFALFRPDTRVRWNGNIKKFRICSDPDEQECELGELLDQDEEVAIGDDSRILDTATSIWTATGVEDGAQIELGGAGDAVPLFDSEQRVLYTDAGIDAGPPTAVNLGDTAYRMEFENTQYQAADAFRDNACLSSDPAEIGGDCDELMLWMLGEFELNQDDTQRASPNDSSRWGVPDPLHSSPSVVTYGADGGDPDTGDPIDKLFVGTNEGAVHMINADSGIIEWSFIASEMLEVQEQLASNVDQADHIYGLDLTPSIRLNDENGDGIIDPSDGDFVHLYIGMRRGGSSLYALDVTPDGTNAIENNDLGLITPKFLWRIIGGVDEFVRLGQTWSRPIVTDIRFGSASEAKTVLLMGGGYDEGLDNGFGTAATNDEVNFGNAIYIIDPDEGVDADDRVIFWMTRDDDDDTDEKIDVVPDPDLKVPNMDFSFVSELATFDADGDGLTDRVYVGDLGGQLWRVDLGSTLDVDDRGGTIVGRLADLSIAAEDTADPTDLPDALADERRFMNPPDVVQVRDFEFTETGSERYDMVSIASGNRADPLNSDITNRIYAIRDFDIGGMADTSPDPDGDGLADDYPVTGGAAYDNDDLVDVTDNLIQDGTEAQAADVKAALKSGFGWYIDLEGTGEKGLSRPVVLAGKMFVTTFLPEANQDPCTAAEGEGQLYGLNILTGAAELDWDDIVDTLSKADRILVLGSGIPSGAVPVFQEAGITLLIGTGGGAASVDPNVVLPRTRTYWFQQDL